MHFIPTLASLSFCFFAEISSQAKLEAGSFIKGLQLAHDSAARPPQLPEPAFRKRFPEVPKLDNYEDIPEWYWDHWPVNPLPTEVRGYVDHETLRTRCKAAGVSSPMVDTVCDRLRDGADIGARGQGTTKLTATNHQGFFTPWRAGDGHDHEMAPV